MCLIYGSLTRAVGRGCVPDMRARGAPMSLELVSLTMMVIVMAGAERELWREAATMSSIPVEFSMCDAPSGISALGDGGVDICILDGTLTEPELAAALPQLGALTPATHVFVCARRNGARP